jgi:hypothetical protein
VFFRNSQQQEHCKKGSQFFRPQPGCQLLNSPWPGINFFTVNVVHVIHNIGQTPETFNTFEDPVEQRDVTN